MSGGALEGVFVLDFTAYLPGPLATLMMADAGAEVVKVERPGTGEAGRADPAIFALLNRGKRSIALNLKAEAKRLEPLVRRADVLIEQFRPGVMDRLGLGFDDLAKINPKIIYASISGYGAIGRDHLKAGHDLTYSAEAGLLSLNADENGKPMLPSALAADIGGGSYAAFSSIMTALFRRERTGEGARLDIAMIEGAFPFLNEAVAHSLIEGRAVSPGYSPALGSSPRYNIYETADGRHLACASVEEKFWENFCEAAELSTGADEKAVAARLRERSAAAWLEAFNGKDIPCALVRSVGEALAEPSLQRFFDRTLVIDGKEFSALPGTIDRSLKDGRLSANAPALGEANDEYLK